MHNRELEHGQKAHNSGHRCLRWSGYVE